MLPLYRAVHRHRFSFLSLPGVVSFGHGVKIIRGRYTGIPSLLLGVKKKLPLHAIPRDELIPRFIDSLPTDVIEIGTVSLLGYALPGPGDAMDTGVEFRKKKLRPARPGVSAGHYEVTAGTLGAVVRGQFPDGIAILSNNHIFANSTDGRDGRAFIGDPILQPGPYDGGGPDDIIARLHSYSPLIPERKDGKGPLNAIDAAIAVPVNPEVVASPVLGLGPVRQTAPARPGMIAHKSGRSSGVTRGTVFSVDTTVRAEGDGKNYIFEDQIGLSAKSEPGDSGSLVVSQYGKAVGLLFAGSEKRFFASPIDRVLEFFGVTLYS